MVTLFKIKKIMQVEPFLFTRLSDCNEDEILITRLLFYSFLTYNSLTVGFKFFVQSIDCTVKSAKQIAESSFSNQRLHT